MGHPALFFDASSGQIRIPDEQNQPLELPCGSLTTLKFTQSSSAIEVAIKLAHDATQTYFEN
jgi:hypothetical protein